jgi:16S rRNA processing protein RimM
MNHREGESSESFVSIARAVRPRGLKGEIVAVLLTDFPERFESLTHLVALSPNGQRSVVDLEDYWFQKDRVILKLAGYDDPEKAKELTGYEFAVPEADRVQLEDDQYYDWELEGCNVRVVDGYTVGKVRTVIKTGGVEILVVSDEGGKESLVPLAASIVVEIDAASKTILIDPPEGLLEL